MSTFLSGVSTPKLVWRDKYSWKFQPTASSFPKPVCFGPPLSFLSLFSEVWNGSVAGISSVVSANSSICINSALPAKHFCGTFPSAGSKGHEGPIKWYFEGLQMCDSGCVTKGVRLSWAALLGAGPSSSVSTGGRQREPEAGLDRASLGTGTWRRCR